MTPAANGRQDAALLTEGSSPRPEWWQEPCCPPSGAALTSPTLPKLHSHAVVGNLVGACGEDSIAWSLLPYPKLTNSLPFIVRAAHSPCRGPSRREGHGPSHADATFWGEMESLVWRLLETRLGEHKAEVREAVDGSRLPTIGLRSALGPLMASSPAERPGVVGGVGSNVARSRPSLSAYGARWSCSPPPQRGSWAAGAGARRTLPQSPGWRAEARW